MKVKLSSKRRCRRREPWRSKTIEAMKRMSPRRRIYAIGLGHYVVPPYSRLNVTVFPQVTFRVVRLCVPHTHSQVMVCGVTVAGNQLLRAFFPVSAIVFAPEIALNYLWSDTRKRKNVARSCDRICVLVENETGKPQPFTGALIGPEL